MAVQVIDVGHNGMAACPLPDISATWEGLPLGRMTYSQ
jgi:hypothetical protein